MGNHAGKVNWGPNVEPSMTAGESGFPLKIPQQGGGGLYWVESDGGEAALILLLSPG